jgi:hypothetical protein
MVLNHRGWYVLLDPLGHPHYHAPGILKIHHRNLDVKKAWSDGFFPSRRTGTENLALPPLATGPAGLTKSGEEVLDRRLEAAPEPGWGTIRRPQRMVSVWRRRKDGRVEAALGVEALSPGKLGLTGWSRDGEWAVVEPEGSAIRFQCEKPARRDWASAGNRVATARGRVNIRLGSGQSFRARVVVRG